MESQDERVRRVIAEEVALAPHDPRWPEIFQQEKARLLALFPEYLTGRIEHFGSTAVPGLAAKPIVDMLVEIADLALARQHIAPVLESLGYDYFWRPTWGDDGPPFYAWFIKRNEAGIRQCHIHVVEPHFEHWNRLRFRDYLIAHPETAREYEALKWRLAREHAHDRVAYTAAKTDFITAVMRCLA